MHFKIIIIIVYVCLLSFILIACTTETFLKLDFVFFTLNLLYFIYSKRELKIRTHLNRGFLKLVHSPGFDIHI